MNAGIRSALKRYHKNTIYIPSFVFANKVRSGREGTGGGGRYIEKIRVLPTELIEIIGKSSHYGHEKYFISLQSGLNSVR